MLKQLLLGSSAAVLLLASSLSVRAETPHPEPPFLASQTAQGRTSSDLMSKYAATDAVPVLQLGSQGQVVEDVQKFLKQAGIYRGAIDGTFGPELKAAVVRFQKQANLIADGVVGLETWKEIIYD